LSKFKIIQATALDSLLTMMSQFTYQKQLLVCPHTNHHYAKAFCDVIAFAWATFSYLPSTIINQLKTKLKHYLQKAFSESQGCGIFPCSVPL